MFVLNPDSYSLPTYRIGPFTTKDLTTNHRIFHNDQDDVTLLKHYLNNRFGDSYQYTLNGREGIHLALKSYSLRQQDVVSIITTSQNYYISGCVTKEIEKFCKWNREIIPETKVVFINHEFGTVYPNMDQIVSTGLPIIEDCCTTFFSQNKDGKIGKYGDFAIYSFPKFFPIQNGGLLVNNKEAFNLPSAIDIKTIKYIEKVLNWHLEKKEELLEKRSDIFSYALSQYLKLGFTYFFTPNALQVPSVMMLKNNGIIKDLPALKIHLWNHGIQSSVFYGEDAFFIPSHQNLTNIDITFFLKVIESFILNQQI